jgi:prepilin-type processing-associated H-X9-DG protein
VYPADPAHPNGAGPVFFDGSAALQQVTADRNRDRFFW